MITPEQFLNARQQHIQNLIKSILHEYSREIQHYPPSSKGYSVSFSSIGRNSEDELQQIQQGIEKGLEESGWNYEKHCYGIFSYQLFPKED